MFRKIVNYKLIQSFEQYLTKIGCVKNVDNQFSKWNLQHFKACSTKSIDLLYASKDADKNRNLKRIQLRVSLNYEEGLDVPNPNTLTAEQWEHLLELKSEKQRDMYLEFLNMKQRSKLKEKEKKEIRSGYIEKLRDKRTAQIQETKHIVYGLYENRLNLKIQDKTLKRWRNRRLMRSMEHSLKLIFDCSYDEHMVSKEAKNTAKQLRLCFTANRQHKKPFDVHFCNVNYKGATMFALQKEIPTLHNKSFPLKLHKECFTKLFPIERLVYLTPYAANTLDEFNPNDVYIIGSYVDIVNSQTLSLAKAKKSGVRIAKLPIEKYLNWGCGKKFLTLDQMCKILLDIRATGDWNEAMLHVPRRKLG